MIRHNLRLAGLVVVTLLGGLWCVGDPAAPTGGSDIPCDRCDGWVDTVRNADVGDLMAVGSRYATDAINDAIGTSGSEPRVYGLSHVAASDNTIRDIDELVAGVASRFGEQDLTTEVTRARRNYLANNANGHRYYAETTFGLDESIGRSWSMEVPSLTDNDGTASVGFNAGGSLSGRVIAPYGSELDAHIDGNVLSLLLDEVQGRGFVIGRSLEEIEDMQPGEAFALSGRGNAGLYFAVSVPIFMDTITTGLTYNIVLRTTVRVRVTTDTLDVQCVRLEGDEVVVDIGTSHAQVDGYEVRIEDAFGLDGLVAEHIDVPDPVESLLENALERELNRRLTFSARVSESTTSDARLSLSRLRFNLDHARGEEDGAMDTALGQALHGDMRLAQLLSNARHPGVTVEFDMSRSGAQSTSYAGVQVFGMEFFHRQMEREGTIVIQTPEGVRTLLMNVATSSGGAFWWSHQYTRASLAGLTIGPDGVQGEASLYLQFTDEDGTIDRNKLLDTVDGLIVALAGMDIFQTLETEGNAIQARVERECRDAEEEWSDYEGFADCAEQMVAREADACAVALERFEGRVAALSEGHHALVVEAAHLRLATQTVPQESMFVGPSMELVTDYRLDDVALHALMNLPGSQLRSAVESYIRVAGAYRSTDPADRLAGQNDVAEDNRGELDRMSRHWDEYRALYAEQVQLEQIDVPDLGILGESGGFMITDAEDLAQPTVRSFAQARAAVARRLVDRLVQDADDLDVRSLDEEQIVLYSLLAMTEDDQMDLRFDVDMRNDGYEGDAYPDAGYRSSRHHVEGQACSPMSGGMFDIDLLLGRPM